MIHKKLFYLPVRYIIHLNKTNVLNFWDLIYRVNLHDLLSNHLFLPVGCQGF